VIIDLCKFAILFFASDWYNCFRFVLTKRNGFMWQQANFSSILSLS
jgi:hypothetical protein